MIYILKIQETLHKSLIIKLIPIFNFKKRNQQNLRKFFGEVQGEEQKEKEEIVLLKFKYRNRKNLNLIITILKV